MEKPTLIENDYISALFTILLALGLEDPLLIYDPLGIHVDPDNFNYSVNAYSEFNVKKTILGHSYIQINFEISDSYILGHTNIMIYRYLVNGVETTSEVATVSKTTIVLLKILSRNILHIEDICAKYIKM